MARRASRTGTWRWTAPKQRQRQARAPKQDRRTRPPIEPRGHRKPTAVEVAARVNFHAIERTLDDHLAALLGQWQAVRRKQMKDLAGQVVAAKGDPLALASIAAQPQGTDVILGHLRAVARQAGQAALKEAAEQGATVRNLATNDLEAALQARSAAVGVLLARALSEVAARKASQLANPLLTPESVAAAVTAHVEGLGPAWLRDQFNGSLMGAQNSARLVVMASAEGPARYIASELLDTATCGPCRELDGTEFATLVDAEVAYPCHGASVCLGGPRCRGLICAVYGEA